MTAASFGLARAAANTSTGNQTFTDANMAATPNAAMFIMTTGVTDGAAADEAHLCVGAAVSTTARWAYSAHGQHAVSPSNSVRTLRNDACLVILNAAGSAEDARADFVSFGAGSVTVNWSNAPGAAYLVTVILFKVDNAYAGTYQDGSVAIGSTFDVTPGFQTDWMFVMGTSISSLNTITNSGSNRSDSLGVCSAALSQYADSFFAAHAVSTTGSMKRVVSNRVRESRTITGGIGNGHEVTAIGATTITITGRDGTGTNRQNAILALDLPASQPAHVGLYTSPTATGNDGETGPNFQPDLVLLLLGLAEAVDTTYSDGRAGTNGLGAFNATAQFANTSSDQDNVATTNTQSVSNDQAVFVPLHDGATPIEASFVSMDGSGFTLNWSVAPATAKVFPMSAFQAAAAGGVPRHAAYYARRRK